MEHSEGHFTAKDSLNLYFQSWLPSHAPKAVLLIVHGIGDHSGRYGNLVNHFVPRGYAVYGVDLRGHGKSEGERCCINRFSDFVGDLDAFLDIVRARYPGTRIFIVAHSMGGTFAMACVLRRHEKVDGLILSGVLLSTPKDVSGVLKFIARMLSAVLPRIGLYAINADGISRDKKVVEAFRSDPLVYLGKINARLSFEVLKTMAFVNRRLKEIHLPILVMHGTCDMLSPLKNSERLFRDASSTDKTLKLYEGFYHSLMNEPGHEQVLADMESWLGAHI